MEVKLVNQTAEYLGVQLAASMAEPKVGLMVDLLVKHWVEMKVEYLVVRKA